MFAYGTLLGAWDAASLGPVHLARIGEDRPEFRERADWALANLMVAGRDAARVRAEVIAVLQGLEGNRDQTARSFGVLPRIASRLVADRSVAKESLASFSGGNEAASFDGFAGLVGLAFLSADSEAGRAVVSTFIRAAVDGIVDERTVVQVLRAMKESCPRAAELGHRLERSLMALRRTCVGADRKGDPARHRDRRAIGVIDRLLDTFFGGAVHDKR